MGWNGEITASVTLTNTGARDASEVVQLYIRDRAASITQPARLLKGFRRVTVPAGGSVEVSLPLTFADLLFLGPDLTPTVEAGAFDVWLSPNAQAGEPARFTLTRCGPAGPRAALGARSALPGPYAARPEVVSPATRATSLDRCPARSWLAVTSI